MGRLIVLGDSFAEMSLEFPHDPWQLTVSKHFKKELINIAANGASCEWLTFQWSKISQELNRDDIVIVLIPFWYRVCVWPNKPNFTHLSAMDQLGKDRVVDQQWSDISQQEREAFKNYFLHLMSDELTELKMFNLLNYVNNYAHYLDNKPLIINTREQVYPKSILYNCDVALGDLMKVSTSEFESKTIWDEMTKHGLFKDPRCSHLTKENHLILANKIIEYILQGKLPNLTTDFKHGFLNKNMLEYS
jgi:hypothetical protein